MKKICYVVTLPLTIRAFFIPQLQYLASNGFDVSVICSPDECLQSELGESVHFIPCMMPRGIAGVESLQAIHRLFGIFKSERFDLVQYSTPNAAFYASIASSLVRIKVRNYHLMGLKYIGYHGALRGLLKGMEKLSCTLSTSIECVSNSNLEFAVQEGLFKKGKGLVVGHGSTGGVDTEKFDISKKGEWRVHVREKLGISEDAFVYGFAGRITGDKGINELLDAFFRLDNGSVLLLVGTIEDEGSLDSGLFERARRDTNVVFQGFTNDIERYYAAMDVLVLPSYREGFGNVVIEAAAMGVPAIVSNIPGPMDAIQKGITALTVEPKSVENLKNSMETMLHSDYFGMGKAANCFVKECFDSRVLCNKILERKLDLLDE